MQQTNYHANGLHSFLRVKWCDFAEMQAAAEGKSSAHTHSNREAVVSEE